MMNVTITVNICWRCFILWSSVINNIAYTHPWLLIVVYDWWHWEKLCSLVGNRTSWATIGNTMFNNCWLLLVMDDNGANIPTATMLHQGPVVCSFNCASLGPLSYHMYPILTIYRHDSPTIDYLCFPISHSPCHSTIISSHYSTIQTAIEAFP